MDQLHSNRSGQGQAAQKYAVATVGSKTKRGGDVVTGRPGHHIGEHLIACVGDLVRYPDGSESVIVSGAVGHLIDDKPVALVGSHIANGDRIVSSPQTAVEIIVEEDAPPIVGLLQPGLCAAQGSIA